MLTHTQARYTQDAAGNITTVAPRARQRLMRPGEKKRIGDFADDISPDAEGDAPAGPGAVPMASE